MRRQIRRPSAWTLLQAEPEPSSEFAITEHTIETITPTAQSWGLAVIPYSVPDDDGKAKEEDALNTQTRQAAKDVLADLSSPVPKFQAPIKQEFAAPFDKLPSNNWGAAEPLPAGTDCK